VRVAEQALAPLAVAAARGVEDGAAPVAPGGDLRLLEEAHGVVIGWA
jgi:hypothetical protein